MKDEIKEILDDLLFTTTLPNVTVKLNKEKLNQLKDYITNLQEIEQEHKNCTKKHWQQKCAEHCANEMIYKLRNEKAIKCIKDKYYKEEYERKGTFTNKLMNILQGEDKDE